MTSARTTTIGTQPGSPANDQRPQGASRDRKNEKCKTNPNTNTSPERNNVKCPQMYKNEELPAMPSNLASFFHIPATRRFSPRLTVSHHARI